MVYRLRVVFSKQGPMRYISHLDLMRLFMRALRRADLPVKITEGFHPHPKISFARALKLGVESVNEEAIICFSEYIKPEELRRRFQLQLPEGITIMEVGFSWLKKS